MTHIPSPRLHRVPTQKLSALRTPRMHQAIASSLAVGLAFSLALGVPSTASAKGADSAAAIEKPIRTLINAVRYSKDDLALKMLDGDSQGQSLLEADWGSTSEEQRTRFKQLFHQLFAAIAFPQIRDNFEHLETILYEKPEVKGNTATIRSTLVILHPLKKQEIKVEYDMKKNAGNWQVVDVTILGTGGNSFLADIRTQQVRPIFGQGGWEHLIKTMETRAQQLEARKKAASK